MLDRALHAVYELHGDDRVEVLGVPVGFSRRDHARIDGTGCGIAAADPDLLPVGSVIQVDRLGEKYNGIYTIMDTGPKVQGRHIDVYMWSCNEALQFGRRKMEVTVLRLGWNPRDSGADLKVGLGG